jgi:DNA polymerase III epsilon subunit family exonuclease
MESKAAAASADLQEDPVFEQIRQEVARLGRSHDNARLDRLLGELATPIVFVDLETTGGNVQLDRITEIGLVEISRSGVDTWTTLVDPGQDIPPFIQDLTGISNEMVRGQPVFGALADSLAERLEGKLFVAHNARFDYGFLQRSFERAGIRFEADMLCTVQLSRKLFPSAARHGLSALIERFSLEPLGRHRALADADLIWQFWQVIHAHHPVEHIQTAIESLTRRPPRETGATGASTATGQSTRAVQPGAAVPAAVPVQQDEPTSSRESEKQMQQTEDRDEPLPTAGAQPVQPTDLGTQRSEDLKADLGEDVKGDLRGDLGEDLREDLREGLKEGLSEGLREDLRDDVPKDPVNDVTADVPKDVATDFALVGNEAPTVRKTRSSGGGPRARRRAAEPLVAQMTFDWGDAPAASETSGTSGTAGSPDAPDAAPQAGHD